MIGAQRQRDRFPRTMKEAFPDERFPAVEVFSPIRSDKFVMVIIWMLLILIIFLAIAEFFND